MAKKSQVLAITLVMVFTASCLWANSTPVVSNVSASQRGDDSKLVDIYYDLTDADGDTCEVWFKVSDDNGVTWDVTVDTFWGQIGDGITSGIIKHIVWDAGTDLPGAFGSGFKIKVTAEDGQVPAGMVFITGGEFMMGDHHDGMSNAPVHAVYISSFYMSKYETTNGQYCDYLNSANSAGQIKIVNGIVYSSSDSSNIYPYCNTEVLNG